MLSQQNPSRKSGIPYVAKNRPEDAESRTTSGGQAIKRANVGTREIGTHSEQDHGFQGSRVARGYSVEGCKAVRLSSTSTQPTQAEFSMISYKPQIAAEAPEKLVEGFALDAFWERLQESLEADMRAALFHTWIKPCRLVAVDAKTVTIATSSSLGEIKLRDNRGIIERACSELLGWPVRLRSVIDPSMDTSRVSSQPAAPASPTPTREYPLAKFQNPTNNPQVAVLLEKYGDMRQVFLKSPMFDEVCRPIDKGGWGTTLGNLIALAKEYSLERVLWAVKVTKQYRGADDRGRVFCNAVKKGSEVIQ